MKVILLMACVPLMLSAATGHEIRRLLKDADVRTAVDKLRGSDDAEESPGALRDVAVDVDQERFLQFTRLRVSGARLDGDFQLLSNAVAEDFRGGGSFSAPEGVVTLSRNLGPALVAAARFFSDAKLSPGARLLLDEYLRSNDVDPSTVKARLGGNTTRRSGAEMVASQMYERLVSQDIDEIVDFLLDVVRGKIRESGDDEMQIPDQDCLRKKRHRKSRKVFYAAGGTMKGVSRLTRVGPTKVRLEGSVITVDCPLQLDRLEARYEAYGLQVSGLKVASGGVRGGVKASPVEVRVDVSMVDDGCSSASVRRLRVTPGEVRLRLAGLASSHPMVARVDACFADLFRDSIAPRIERVLRDAVSRTLHEFRCPR